MNARKLLLERVLPLAVLALAVIAVPILVFRPSGVQRLETLSAERSETEEEISRLSKDIEGLRSEVRRIKADPSAVEQVARDELGLVRQTEIVFQFKR